jgi:hypothetical protein
MAVAQTLIVLFLLLLAGLKPVAAQGKLALMISCLSSSAGQHPMILHNRT